MLTFFSILFALLAINILLLVFSLKGSSKSVQKKFGGLSDENVTKLYPEGYTKEKYKKAV